MAQVFILFYYTASQEAVTFPLITEDYCQSQNDCDNTYVETVYKWFKNFKIVYMHQLPFINNHQCYVVVKCCPWGQSDVITHVAIYFLILWVLYRVYSSFSIIISFFNLLSFVISAIPNTHPRPILSLFLLKVLQADQLANETSWTLFQALRCLKTYFLMLPVALVLWVVRFQHKQND